GPGCGAAHGRRLRAGLRHRPAAAPRHRRLTLPLRLELQGGAVHAVAQAGGLGAVREDMAEMAAAARAMDLGPLHQMSVVFARGHGAGDRLQETRPAGAAFKLRLRLVQRLAAAGAAKHTLAVLVVEGAGAGPLRAMTAQHAVLLRGQPGAPLFIGLLDRELLFRIHARTSPMLPNHPTSPTGRPQGRQARERALSPGGARELSPDCSRRESNREVAQKNLRPINGLAMVRRRPCRLAPTTN